MLLLTELGDKLLTERSDNIAIDFYETCLWPTLDEVKTELGVVGTADDAYLTRHISATIASIERYTHRALPLEERTEEFKITDCDRAFGYMSRLQLKSWPVLQLISVKDLSTGVAISATLDEYGMMCGCFPNYSLISVNYHGGLACDSEDFNLVLDTFWQMIAYRYSQKSVTAGAAGALKSESIPGVMTTSYYNTVGADSTTSGNPADAAFYSGSLDLLKAYFV